MNEKEINTSAFNDTTTAPRPWIEPTFERVTLIEAQSSQSFGGSDNTVYQS